MRTSLDRAARARERAGREPLWIGRRSDAGLGRNGRTVSWRDGDYWVAVFWSLLPTVVVSALFFFILRSILRADRTERRVYARIEAEERAKRGPSAARRDRVRALTATSRLRWDTPCRRGGQLISITFDATWWLVLVFVTDLAIRIAAIIIVPRNRRPTAAMAWLLAIYFIPLIGVFLFLLIGNPRLPRKRRRKQEQINTYIHDTSEHLDFGTLRPHAPDWFTSMVTLNRNLGAMPLAGDNAAHLISDYQQSLDAMADADPRGRPLRAHRVLHPPDGCRDRQPLPRARGGRARAASPCGCCWTTGRTAASRSTRRRSSASTRWARSGT